MALALRYAGVPRAEQPRRTAELLERVGLSETADRRDWEISGGQQQRAAIARALAGGKGLLLLDEPFAALDALTRERLQEDLRRVSLETGATSVFVTHSVDEAATPPCAHGWGPPCAPPRPDAPSNFPLSPETLHRRHA